MEISSKDEIALRENIQAKLNTSTAFKGMLPRWVKGEVLDILHLFLTTNNLDEYTIESEISVRDSYLQRLLWTADFLQIEEFGEECIRKVILPRIETSNCLMLLNESFKKLKANAESSDAWYLLLNNTLNFSAKQLFTIYSSDPKSLLSINSSIVTDIFERSLKYFLRKNPSRIQASRRLQPVDSTSTSITSLNQFLDIMQFLHNFNSRFQLLTHLRNSIIKKNIDYTNHPTISWKLLDYRNITLKETNVFKFNEYSWKLVARMESICEEKPFQQSFFSSLSQQQQQNQSQITPSFKNKKVLRVYLHLIDDVSDKDSMKYAFKNILATHTMVKVDKKEDQLGLRIRYFVLDGVHSEILLAELEVDSISLDQLGQNIEKQEVAQNNKAELTVYLGVEILLSCLLNELATSCLQRKTHEQFAETLSPQETLIMIRSLPRTREYMEVALSVLQDFLRRQDKESTSSRLMNQQSDETNFHEIGLEILKEIEFECLSLESLQSLRDNPAISNQLEWKKYFEDRLISAKSENRIWVTQSTPLLFSPPKSYFKSNTLGIDLKEALLTTRTSHPTRLEELIEYSEMKIEDKGEEAEKKSKWTKKRVPLRIFSKEHGRKSAGLENSKKERYILLSQQEQQRTTPLKRQSLYQSRDQVERCLSPRIHWQKTETSEYKRQEIPAGTVGIIIAQNFAAEIPSTIIERDSYKIQRQEPLFSTPLEVFSTNPQEEEQGGRSQSEFLGIDSNQLFGSKKYPEHELQSLQFNIFSGQVTDDKQPIQSLAVSMPIQLQQSGYTSQQSLTQKQLQSQESQKVGSSVSQKPPLWMGNSGNSNEKLTVSVAAAAIRGGKIKTENNKLGKIEFKKQVLDSVDMLGYAISLTMMNELKEGNIKDNLSRFFGNLS